MTPYKGKRRTGDPVEIPGVAPASSYSESPAEAQRRQRDAAMPRSLQNARRTHFWRRFLVVAAVFAVVLLGGTAFAVYQYAAGVNNEMTQQFQKIGGGKLAGSLTPQRKPTEPFYILLLGADMRVGEKQARSDSLILARVDPVRKHIALISIPRDTKADIPGYKTQKINAAMQLGGPPLVIETVKQLTGLPITHFVQVNFWGFKDMVDAIGGVYVAVPKRISDIKAANHDESAMVVEKGYQKLDGKHALTFVRSRAYAEGDYIRMKNQQAFIKALLKQTLQAKNVFSIGAITQAMLHNVVTDMSLQQVLALVNDFKDMNPNAVESATMPSTPKYIDKVAYVILDEQGMQEMVARLAAGKPLTGAVTATPAVDPAGTAPAPGTTSDGAVKPASVAVTVRNGAGLHGVASAAQTRLTNAGFKVPETGNAQRFVYPQTLIIYNDNLPAAEAVQQALAGTGRIVKSRGMYMFKTDVLVVIGKDWPKSAAAAPASNPGQ
jgi:LCP family protein required for cell wall assembly